MIKFYCDDCMTPREVTIEPITMDMLNQEAWGDIVCDECSGIIATASADVEGKLVFIPNEPA